MNFEEFKDWREHILATHEVPSENRFDCLNPFKAMEFSRKWSEGGDEWPSFERETAQEKWKSILFQSVSSESLHFEPTRGVRSALGRLFERMEADGMELWLPEDVYPFYKQEVAARAPALSVCFKTIPAIDFAELSNAADNAVVLIADPLTPTGRYLNSSERVALKRWSKLGKGRWVIFDSVYHYHWKVTEHIVTDILEGRFIHLFSMSKGYLHRGVFGFAIGDENTGDWWKNLDLAPTVEACDGAKSALINDPFMPHNQEIIFKAEWMRRRHKLVKHGPVHPRAGSGYFRRINVNFEKAFKEDGLLLVPASVFGSSENEWSIATYLYEAARSKL
jgi:aspartate/methionine/tyrosine aminotransferase